MCWPGFRALGDRRGAQSLRSGYGGAVVDQDFGGLEKS